MDIRKMLTERFGSFSDDDPIIEALNSRDGLREAQVSYLREFEGPDSTGEPVILFAGTAEDLLDRLAALAPTTAPATEQQLGPRFDMETGRFVDRPAHSKSLMRRQNVMAGRDVNEGVEEAFGAPATEPSGECAWCGEPRSNVDMHDSPMGHAFRPATEPSGEPATVSHDVRPGLDLTGYGEPARRAEP